MALSESIHPCPHPLEPAPSTGQGIHCPWPGGCLLLSGPGHLSFIIVAHGQVACLLNACLSFIAWKISITSLVGVAQFPAGNGPCSNPHNPQVSHNVFLNLAHLLLSLSLCLSIFLCLFICVYLSQSLSVCLSVYVSLSVSTHSHPQIHTFLQIPVDRAGIKTPVWT